MAMAHGWHADLAREGRRLRASAWEWSLLSWVPLLGCALLWWIFAAGLPRDLGIGVVDEDHSALSRQLVRWLQASPGLAVQAHFENPAQAQQALREAAVAAVVRIPAGFTSDIKHARTGVFTLWHNAQWGTHSGLLQRDVRTVVATLSAGIEMLARTKRGESAQTVRVAMEPIRTDMVTLFNPALDYEYFLATALVPALLHIAAMTAGAWGVGRELREATLGEWLGARPRWGRCVRALGAKLLWPWLGLGLVATLALGWLVLGRHWPVQGHSTLVLLALWVFLGLSLAMGALAASASASLRTALSATGFITAPAFAFSGVGFPVVAMPTLAQWWAQALPYTHYVRVQVLQWQMGAPAAYAWPIPAGMALLAVLLLLASARALQTLADQPQRWGKR
ncbi:MAG: ABC transporter permease [Rhodoferax sp.]